MHAPANRNRLKRPSPRPDASPNRRLFRQTKNIKCCSPSHCHKLVPIGQICHGTARHCSTQRSLPQTLAIPSIQREEIPLSTSREEQVRSRGQNTALGVINHLEIPLLIAR